MLVAWKHCADFGTTCPLPPTRKAKNDTAFGCMLEPPRFAWLGLRPEDSHADASLQYRFFNAFLIVGLGLAVPKSTAFLRWVVGWWGTYSIIKLYI